jgi:hypothetical protein
VIRQATTLRLFQLAARLNGGMALDSLLQRKNESEQDVYGSLGLQGRTAGHSGRGLTVHDGNTKCTKLRFQDIGS